MKNKYIFLHIITVLSCLHIAPLISKPSQRGGVPSAPKNIPLNKPSSERKESSQGGEKEGPRKGPGKNYRKTDPALKKFIDRFTKAVNHVPEKKPHDKKDTNSKDEKPSDDSEKSSDDKKDEKKSENSDSELKEYRKNVKKAKEAYERLFHYNKEHHPNISKKDDEEVRKGARKLFRLTNIQNMVWRSNQNVRNKSKNPSKNKKDNSKQPNTQETKNNLY